MMHHRTVVTSRITLAVLGVGLSSFALAVVAYLAGVRLNTSGSIPPGLYRVTRGKIARGSTVLACLPATVSAFARARGYVPPGSCADGGAPVGKVVAAVEGDTVDVSARGVEINGVLVRNSAPMSRDAEGRGLPTLRISRHVVPSSELWLVSSYSPLSFDSRYFGGIAASRVITRIRPLLTAR